MKLIRSLLLGLVAFGLSGIANAQVASRLQAPSAAAEIGRVLCAAACNLTGFQVNTGAVAGWVMLFNATAVPADGTVAPVKWWQVAINTTLEIHYQNPLRMTTGATVVFSSTGPFTKTGSATALFSGEVQ